MRARTGGSEKNFPQEESAVRFAWTVPLVRIRSTQIEQIYQPALASIGPHE